MYARQKGAYKKRSIAPHQFAVVTVVRLLSAHPGQAAAVPLPSAFYPFIVARTIEANLAKTTIEKRASIFITDYTSITRCNCQLFFAVYGKIILGENMLKSDFCYDLPKELIAQTPIEPRNASRLLSLGRESGKIQHGKFTDLYELLKPGDLLILNDSRVLPARILGISEDMLHPMEFLLLQQKQKNVWEVLVKPGKRAKIGSRFIFGEGLLRAEVKDIIEGGNRLVKFEYEGDFGSFYTKLERIGQMPLPPYITEKLDNPERYQTVYSRKLGSAAAPTAGLHFTAEMLDKLRENGVKTAFVTLHVGLGTFRPVKEDDINNHKMHSEHIYLPAETAKMINETKQSKTGRVIAVGTTSCRTLEAVGQQGMPLKEYDGYTEIFLYPGKQFNVIDGLITNFHLPESTLIMLVSAFAGREHTLNAYAEAVKEKYRFFSFGDAMFIV